MIMFLFVATMWVRSSSTICFVFFVVFFSYKVIKSHSPRIWPCSSKDSPGTSRNPRAKRAAGDRRGGAESPLRRTRGAVTSHSRSRLGRNIRRSPLKKLRGPSVPAVQKWKVQMRVVSPSQPVLQHCSACSPIPLMSPLATWLSPKGMKNSMKVNPFRIPPLVVDERSRKKMFGRHLWRLWVRV